MPHIIYVSLILALSSSIDRQAVRRFQIPAHRFGAFSILASTLLLCMLALIGSAVVTMTGPLTPPAAFELLKDLVRRLALDSLFFALPLKLVGNLLYGPPTTR